MPLCQNHTVFISGSCGAWSVATKSTSRPQSFPKRRLIFFRTDGRIHFEGIVVGINGLGIEKQMMWRNSSALTANLLYELRAQVQSATTRNVQNMITTRGNLRNSRKSRSTTIFHSGSSDRLCTDSLLHGTRRSEPPCPKNSACCRSGTFNFSRRLKASLIT